MWIYLFKVSTIVLSFFLIKLIFAIDDFGDSRAFLKALAVAGALSLLEFGLGDHLLKQIQAGRGVDSLALETRRLLFRFLLASVLCIGILNYASPVPSMQEFAITVGIFLYSMTNVLLGLHQKTAFAFKCLRSSYRGFSVMVLMVMLASGIWLRLSGDAGGALIVILYGCTMITVLVLKDFRRLELPLAGLHGAVATNVGRVWLSSENILNSVTLMLMGIAIASLPDEKDMMLFSIYSRIVNVIAMLGMLYVLTIWRSDRQRASRNVSIHYFLVALLVMFLAALIEPVWAKFLVRELERELGVSLLIASSLVCWRVLADLASQVSKRKSAERLALLNAVLQFGLFSVGLFSDWLGFFSATIFFGVLGIGSAASFAILWYVLAIQKRLVDE
jgi:hypothetical protein